MDIHTTDQPAWREGDCWYRRFTGPVCHNPGVYGAPRGSASITAVCRWCDDHKHPGDVLR